MVQGKRKEEQGTVKAKKMDKTAVVAVERYGPHPLYGKMMRWFKKYYVHDEKNECQSGDVVKIVEVRPLSKLKRWRLKEIVKKSTLSEPAAHAPGRSESKARDSTG